MDWLALAAQEAPDRPALIGSGGEITYGQLDAAANAVAQVLERSGLGGKAVAFWGRPRADTVAAVWGIPRAGVTAVPIDPRMPPAEAMALTREAGVRGLWATPDGGIDRLVARGETAPRLPGPDGAGRYVVFTSGSSGYHKGVVLAGDSIRAAVLSSAARLGHGPADTWLCVLPLFHVGGLSILWRQAFSGAPVLLQERFDPAETAEVLATADYASLVPTMLRRIVDLGAAAPSSARAVLVGGAPADGPLLERARTMGIAALPTYGMTETCSQLATPTPGDPLDGTVGEPVPGAEVRVVVDGEAMIGAEGMIEARGEMLFSGYLGEEPREPEAWFRTHDLGVLGEDGRLTVLGRADAAISTGGEIVHPAMVERLLLENPEISDVRVFGVPDPEWGQVVTAEVVGPGLDPARLQEWARRHLAPALVPRAWRVVARIDHKLGA